ncbi:MAG: T9SS type A sorting domain-containing protein [Ignavibacteria bacterium]|nr:T9SS type A sorting domain-containing protein [Ignavibacteria bacterium]
MKLEVYDISGRMIKQLVNQKQNPGKYNYTFDGSDLPSAVYFYKLTTEDFTETKKMVWQVVSIILIITIWIQEYCL